MLVVAGILGEPPEKFMIWIVMCFTDSVLPAGAKIGKLNVDYVDPVADGV